MNGAVIGDNSIFPSLILIHYALSTVMMQIVVDLSAGNLIGRPSLISDAGD